MSSIDKLLAEEEFDEILKKFEILSIEQQNNCPSDWIKAKFISLIKLGRISEAVEWFNRHDKHFQDHENKFLFSYCQYRMKNFNASLESLNDCDDYDKVKVICLKAQNYYRLGAYKESSRHYEVLLNEYPDYSDDFEFMTNYIASLIPHSNISQYKEKINMWMNSLISHEILFNISCFLLIDDHHLQQAEKCLEKGIELLNTPSYNCKFDGDESEIKREISVLKANLAYVYLLMSNENQMKSESAILILNELLIESDETDFIVNLINKLNISIIKNDEKLASESVASLFQNLDSLSYIQKICILFDQYLCNGFRAGMSKTIFNLQDYTETEAKISNTKFTDLIESLRLIGYFHLASKELVIQTYEKITCKSEIVNNLVIKTYLKDADSCRNPDMKIEKYRKACEIAQENNAKLSISSFNALLSAIPNCTEIDNFIRKFYTGHSKDKINIPMTKIYTKFLLSHNRQEEAYEFLSNLDEFSMQESFDSSSPVPIKKVKKSRKKNKQPKVKSLKLDPERWIARKDRSYSKKSNSFKNKKRFTGSSQGTI